MTQKAVIGNQYLHNRTTDSNICEIANPTLPHQSMRGTKEDSNRPFLSSQWRQTTSCNNSDESD